MNGLLKRDTKRRWSTKEAASFAPLEQPTLDRLFFSGTAPAYSHTDASGKGVVLLQKDQYVMERPVTYASRKLSQPESRYDSSEFECLAVVWAFDMFRSYIYEKRFTTVTDNSALRWIK